MAKKGATDWWLADIVNSTPLTGGKDAFVPHVALDSGTGTVLGTVGNPLNVTGSTGGTPAAPSYVAPVDAAGRTGGMATYVATTTGYTAYATPQDMLSIFGSATKTVAVTRFLLFANATAGALTNFQFIRRSAANSGGTPTALTIIKNDSGNAAATAAPVVYGAAPTPGASAGVFSYVSVTIAATTAAPTPIGPMSASALNGPLGFSTALLDLRQPIILRGVAEGITLNFVGAALPTGFTANAFVEWVEY